MESRRRIELRDIRRFFKRTLLVRTSPSGAIGAAEDQLLRRSAGGERCENRAALVCEGDVARLASLREPNRDHASLGIEVGGAHPRQLPITTSGDERAAN